MPEDESTVREQLERREVARRLLLVADYIAPSFPHHANGMRSELIGTKLTNERWNRCTALMASIAAVPGVTLCAEEHLQRNVALASVVVAQYMARATFGGPKSEGALEFAMWRSQEIVDGL